ncbi:hypothetical protein, partial [Aneurinibacillus thermoaerophilus]|uniref:hypothetical protein n=1 Tax=Aneurinibacillus thermoaerophilus TaxID=143495 RepID=UPI002E1BBE4F|nr:hypothetical protein [Aneurinibacillus thermoaerophilus]
MEEIFVEQLKKSYNTIDLIQIAKKERIHIRYYEVCQDVQAITTEENGHRYILVNLILPPHEQQEYIKKGVLAHLLYPNRPILFTEQKKLHFLTYLRK